jgi:hypothetical protein
MASVITASQAQKSGKSSKSVQGYAITAADKGGHSWREVRLMDISAGTEVKNIYDSKKEPEILNARTGKAIEKKEQKASQASTITITRNASPEKKVVNLDDALSPGHATHSYTRVFVYNNSVSTDKPFATNSAAMAYDKKHERLYYTPMSIAQLRYIDLKSGKIYYFEDEEFGVVKSGGDIGNQITRMVIAADGNGYALTNNANHLIRFTTGKKPEITDLGELTDDGASKFSIHSTGGYGGDIIADASNNLYLITANKNVFRISIKTKVASYAGTITGLPRGFSTNGAMVEEGSKVIVASSESTVGYYRFDLNTFQAERVSPEGEVFNASDLANGVLAFDKKKKDKKDDNEEVKPENKPEENITAKTGLTEQVTKAGIAVYPNPVTDGYVRLSFSQQPAGKYQVQLLDISGKLISSKEVNINGESQVEEFRFPELNVRGNYLIRVTSELNRVNVTNKIVVQ